MTEPEPDVDETPAPVAVALVVLPFPDAQQATVFMQLVQGATVGAMRPVITEGQCYEYLVGETRYQVVGFTGNWEGFETETGALVRREIVTVSETP